MFFLLWLGLAWTLWRPDSSNVPFPKLSFEAPTFRRECETQSIPCVDDCSFLCLEPNAKCVGGTCQVEAALDIPISCDKNKGGMVVMVNEPTPHWTCICTDSSIYSGKDCSQLNEDVCEHGVFLYSGRDNHVCICPEPYRIAIVKGKPHCLERGLAKFFRSEYDENGQRQGPFTLLGV